MSQEDVEIVRSVFEASSRGDTEAVLAHYDLDVEWNAERTQPGVGFGESYRGHDGLRRFFRQWREAWDNDEYELEELIDAGGTVVSVARQQGRGRVSGAAIARPITGVWTIREGKVVRVIWFPTREEALEAVGLRE